MKQNTLEDIYNVLLNETNEITISDEIRKRAVVSIERMLKVGTNQK